MRPGTRPGLSRTQPRQHLDTTASDILGTDMARPDDNGDLRAMIDMLRES